jgi:uncharacterized membrane protein YfcA
MISYTENWVYVLFAAVGSWIGAFASMTFLHRRAGRARRRNSTRRRKYLV